MDAITNQSDLCDSIARRIADALGVEKIGVSSHGTSRYIEVPIVLTRDEDNEPDETETFLIRVSDHEARSYNRTGDYNVTVGGSIDGGTHAFVRADWREERVETEVEVEGDEGPVMVIEEDFVKTYDYDADAADAAVNSDIAAAEARRGASK